MSSKRPHKLYQQRLSVHRASESCERAPNGVEEVPAMLARLLAAHETIITAVRATIEQTSQNGDDGSNDLLMGDVLRTHEQQVWGVAEHLVDTPLVRA